MRSDSVLSRSARLLAYVEKPVADFAKQGSIRAKRAFFCVVKGVAKIEFGTLTPKPVKSAHRKVTGQVEKTLKKAATFAQNAQVEVTVFARQEASKEKAGQAGCEVRWQ